MSRISFLVVAAGLLASMAGWLAAASSQASGVNVEDHSRQYVPAGSRLPSLPVVF